MTDEPKRWIFRVDNSEDQMMSWGSRTPAQDSPFIMAMSVAAEQFATPKHFYDEFVKLMVATNSAVETRTGHSYYSDLLMVWVWQEREHEHYRKEIPEDATLYIYSRTGLVNIVMGTGEYEQWKLSASSFLESESAEDGSSSSRGESSPSEG